MKIITVMMDDYNSSIIGVLVVNDDQVEETIEKLEEAAKRSGADEDWYKWTVTDPDTVESVIECMVNDEDEEKR